MITVIAVPVRKFSRSQLAFSGTPFSDSQLAINSTFPVRRMAPIVPITMIFRIPKLIIYPFKNMFLLVQHSANGQRAQAPKAFYLYFFELVT